MAIGKDKIKQQFEAAIPAALQPGEQVRAETLSLSGTSPWLVGGLLGMLGGQRNYFIVVTDRRVLFFAGSKGTGRPLGLAWADPVDSVTLSDVDIGKAVWSKFRYRSASGKVMRFNIHRLWRDEGAAVVAAMSGGASRTATPAETPAAGVFRP